MSDEEWRRRESDSDAFKYQIVAEQARITTKVELLHDMVKAEMGALKDRVSKIEEKHDILKEAIAGGLAKPGILEQNRNLGKDFAKIIGIISAVGFMLWKVISPIYDSWVVRWIPQRIVAESQSSSNSTRIVKKAK